MLEEARKEHIELRIPILLIPATISNNVPGTDISIGSDTALNAVCEVISLVKYIMLGHKRPL